MKQQIPWVGRCIQNSLRTRLSLLTPPDTNINSMIRSRRVDEEAGHAQFFGVLNFRDLYALDGLSDPLRVLRKRYGA